MSFQDIKKVTQAEQDTWTKKAEAQAEARQIVAAAQKSGAAMVEQARSKAEEQVKTLMSKAEEAAKQQSEKTLAANAEACKAMRKQAETRLDKAADLIVRRVVNL